MDIYALIYSDHLQARQMIAEIDSIPDGRHRERLNLFRQLKKDLTAHNDAEEASFYVALEEYDNTRGFVSEGKHEHHEVEALLDALDDRDLTPEQWRAKFAHFREMLFHHIEEEEGEVFARAREVFSAKSAAELAQIMDQLKQTKLTLLRRAG